MRKCGWIGSKKRNPLHQCVYSDWLSDFPQQTEALSLLSRTCFLPANPSLPSSISPCHPHLPGVGGFLIPRTSLCCSVILRANCVFQSFLSNASTVPYYEGSGCHELLGFYRYVYDTFQTYIQCIHTYCTVRLERAHTRTSVHSSIKFTAGLLVCSRILAQSGLWYSTALIEGKVFFTAWPGGSLFLPASKFPLFHEIKCKPIFITSLSAPVPISDRFWVLWVSDADSRAPVRLGLIDHARWVINRCYRLCETADIRKLITDSSIQRSGKRGHGFCWSVIRFSIS